MPTRVHLCGHLEIVWDDKRLETALPGRQAPLLFAYLTLHRGRPVRRDELIDALWSGEGSPPGGDGLLRPLLSRLRRALGDGRLEGRAELRLLFPDDAWIDWEFAHEALRAGRVAQASGDNATGWERARTGLAVAERGLLPGFEADWLERFRTELEERRIELLETVAVCGAMLGEGELHDAERAARLAVEAAPFRESARAALLQVLRRRGNVAEALFAYDEFRGLLRDELGSAPGPQLLALHAELLRAELPTAAPAPAPDPANELPDRLAQALRSPWVGREAALGRLREEAERAAAGRTGLMLVTGDGGIGKTRLVAELATRLSDFGVLYGRCDEEELFPYGPWVDMLRPELASIGDDELADLLGDGAAELARLLPEIGTRLDLAAAPVAGDPESERRQFFLAVSAVLRRLARRRPLLLVIDDLHWADRSSLLLARHVARRPDLGQVLMLGTYRDTELGPGHPLPELVADVERDREVVRVRLAGLDEAEVAELIGAWHGHAVEARTVRAIRAETDGNPFFVKQLVRHLEEDGPAGELHVEGGFGVPAGVRDVIARRVARLPGAAGRVLGVAALIGRDFDYELLAPVTGLPEDELLDVLDEAVRAALIVEVPRTVGRYSFAHALLRTTLAAELSATRRARLHLRIGEAIERCHSTRLEPWLDELARHFGEAGPQAVDRAIEYAERAADRAANRLAYDEAVGLLAHAVELRRRHGPADLAGIARLERALAASEANAGRGDAARASYGRALEAAREAGAVTAFARAALGHSGGTWEQYGREDLASVALLEEALDRLPPEESSLRAQVLARLAVLLYYAEAAAERVLATATDAVAMARVTGDPDAMVAALIAAQFARWLPGRALDRLAIADELVLMTEQRGVPGCIAEAHLWRATALVELCRIDEADADLARHAEIAEQLQLYQLLGHRDALRAMRALLEGDYERGAAAARDLLEWADRPECSEAPPMTMLRGFYGAELISIHNERDELGLVAPFFEQMVQEMDALPGWRAPLAWAKVQSGRAEDARCEIEDLSADGFAGIPRDTNFLAALAIIAHAVGELRDAELAARVEPQLAPFADSWVVLGPGASTLGPVAYCLGMLQLVQDRHEEAAASFERALELSARMRARPYEARSLAGLAEALRGRGDPGDEARADELSARALAEARALGMRRLERELDQAPVAS
jgi:DNA-binding SARP family transcriptional activator/tetratricopeptide (TPR) repeat protein